jgi:dihydroflavonol-4-reductase
MHAFLTGATGFLGGRLAALLRARGDEVTALARPTAGIDRLLALGVRVARGDVTDRASVRRALEGADAVFHVAAWYELGVRDEARMRSINVDGTRNVLDEALAAGVRTIVHCGSVAALGSTDSLSGRLADEEFVRVAPFGSSYERTKAEAHALASELARSGAPVRIASPGTIFGPGDRSLVAELVRAHLAGLLLAAPFPELTMSLVFVDDAARGLLAVADRGRDGRAYNLVGEVITMGDWITRIADVTGKPAPLGRIPTWSVRLAARTFPLVAGFAGFGPSLAREGLAMADGASWGFSSERARGELGWASCDVDDAIARTLVAFDRARGKGFRPKTERAARALDRVRAGRER